jgi:hypothetical protein
VGIGLLQVRLTTTHLFRLSLARKQFLIGGEGKG